MRATKPRKGLEHPELDVRQRMAECRESRAFPRKDPLERGFKVTFRNSGSGNTTQTLRPFTCSAMAFIIVLTEAGFSAALASTEIVGIPVFESTVMTGRGRTPPSAA